MGERGGAENFTNFGSKQLVFSVSEHPKRIFKVGKYCLNRIFMTFWISAVKLVTVVYLRFNGYRKARKCYIRN